MKGKVNANSEATLQLPVCGYGKLRTMVTAVIDTGYNGSLTLTPQTIRSLRLRRVGRTEAELADGKIVKFEVYTGQVIWEGKRRTVVIHEAETTPLAGMRLLKGYELRIHVVPGGEVSITRRKH